MATKQWNGHIHEMSHPWHEMGLFFPHIICHLSSSVFTALFNMTSSIHFWCRQSWLSAVGHVVTFLLLSVDLWMGLDGSAHFFFFFQIIKASMVLHCCHLLSLLNYSTPSLVLPSCPVCAWFMQHQNLATWRLIIMPFLHSKWYGSLKKNCSGLLYHSNLSLLPKRFGNKKVEILFIMSLLFLN